MSKEMTENRGDYDVFLAALAMRESSGNPKADNGIGYLGLYQMGTLALQDAGFQDAKGRWLGIYGVSSREDFLNSRMAQRKAIERYHKLTWNRLVRFGVTKHIGRTIKGVRITASGMLAGAHLKGIGRKDATRNHLQGVRNFLESGGDIDPADANGTPVSHYMELFGGYDISAIQ